MVWKIAFDTCGSCDKQPQPQSARTESAAEARLANGKGLSISIGETLQADGLVSA